MKKKYCRATAACIISAATITFLSAFLDAQEPAYYADIPPDYTEVAVESEITQVQPMTGMVFWTTSGYRETDAISLEFSYMLFEDIVTDSGVYNWEPVEEKLDAVAGRNHQAIFRFRYVYPGWETSVPAYIKALEDYHETEGESEGKTTWFPDWTHTELQRFTLEFYTRFSERYDEDPRLAFIQVGFGLWGEYHIYNGPRILGETFPSKEFQEEFFHHLDQVFEHTPWSISIDAADDYYSPFEAKPELKEIPFGLFDDSFMHEEHSTYPSEYNMSNWKFFGEERYRENPAGGEFSYYTSYDQQHVLDPEGPHGRSFEDFASQYHITYMMANDQPSYQSMERIREASFHCGYKFRIDRLYVSDDSSLVTVRNLGIAPIYYDAYVTVSGVRAGESLKGLSPGDLVQYGVASGGESPVLTIESDHILEGQTIGFYGTTSTAFTGPPRQLGDLIRIIPGPEGIQLESDAPGLVNLKVFDLQGRILRHYGQVRSLYLTGLPSGTYLLVFSDGIATSAHKVNISS